MKDINYGKVAFQISINYHFRDSIPTEWDDLETEEEFFAVFNKIPEMIDDIDLIVEEWLENEMSEAVANMVYNLWHSVCYHLRNAIERS